MVSATYPIPMLWTLWRAISFEFWRLLILTVSVVVATIAFAVTIKPLADGKLSADQAIRFMFYAVPPMLAYALPFAAGFAATISIHRMSSENEVTAVYASGVSHKRFLFPSLVSGILLASGLLVMNDQVIPRFLKEMERMVTQDFAKIFVTSLQSGESAKIGNNEIHADFVQPMPLDPSSPVIEQYLLGGVAIVKAEDDGTVTIDGTASRAYIQLRPAWSLSAEDQARLGSGDDITVLMKFIEMNINREGSPITVDPFTLPAFPIPRVFKDDPKFMTTTEMRSLRSDPDQMNFVDNKRIDLAKGIASMQVFNQVSSLARAGNSVEFISSQGAGTIRILAGGFSAVQESWTLLPQQATGRIEIEIIDPSGRVDRLRAVSAVINPDRAKTDDPLNSSVSTKPTLDFELSLDGVEVLGSLEEDRPTTETKSTSYSGLRFASDPLDSLLMLKSADLIEYAEPYINPASTDYVEFIVASADRLKYQINDLNKEILSKLHERWAMSAAALVMVLAGSIIALKLKFAQPLVVYQWSFFPALGTIILISGGQQSIHNDGVLGIPVIWSGVFALLIYSWITLRKVSQH
jgi:lipopolysaccharide export LptBFGC system permease protein LptF